MHLISVPDKPRRKQMYPYIRIANNLLSECTYCAVLAQYILPQISEFMGKTFQAAQLTHERFLTIDHSLLQNIFLISAKLIFHRPLVCSTIRILWKFSLADIKKIFCRSDLWSKISHVLVVQLEKFFP